MKTQLHDTGFAWDYDLRRTTRTNKYANNYVNWLVYIFKHVRIDQSLNERVNEWRS
jgi:hypothetical protein